MFVMDGHMAYQLEIAAIMTATALFGLRFIIVHKLRKKQTIENFPVAHQRLIIAMASAANTDGTLEPAELDTIHEMINRLSWREYSSDEVRNLILATKPVQTKSQLAKLGKGLLATQKLAILKAAHAVAGADGKVCNSENGFLNRLATGLKLPNRDVQAVLARQPV